MSRSKNSADARIAQMQRQIDLRDKRLASQQRDHARETARLRTKVKSITNSMVNEQEQHAVRIANMTTRWESERQRILRQKNELLIEFSLLMFCDPVDSWFLRHLDIPILATSSEYRKINPPKVQTKRDVIENDRVCRFCMAADATTVDHLWPMSFGGPSRAKNLVGACCECNSRKGNLLPSQWNEHGIRLHLPARLFNEYFPQK